MGAMTLAYGARRLRRMYMIICETVVAHHQPMRQPRVMLGLITRPSPLLDVLAGPVAQQRLQ